jgi:hypothetical protein
MTDKITPELVQDAKDLRDRFELLKRVIIDRLEYVIETICVVFGENYEQRELGSGDPCLSAIWHPVKDEQGNEFILINARVASSPDAMPFLDSEDSEQDLMDDDDLRIPLRWLFEDFEEELKEGRQRYLDQQASKEENEETIIKTAKAKLTKQELEALTEALQQEQQ